MVKRIGRRFVSLLLTFVTVLTMLPAMTLPALAATGGIVTGLADENIGLSFSGDAEVSWSANGMSIIGAATSTPGSCNTTTDYSSTLTITNKRSTTATLSFDYSIEQNGGTIQVGGTKVSSGASFTKELAEKESVKVSIKSGSASAATKITMTNVKLVADMTATVTFQPAVNGGSYTVDGNAITEVYTHNQSSTAAYQVVATPEDGYQFMGWYDVSNEKYISTVAKTALNFDRDRTITARFVSKELALFETGGQPFDDLGDAVTYAQANGQSKITLAADGSISGTYTIPAGITLLIPFDEAGTLYTTTPAYTTVAETQKAYKTLTMAAGSSITVNGGAISVGGKHFTSSGQECCKPTGAYGLIKMQEGSSITLNNRANLYAWGYITGDGSITANSGANVYEYYQVTDWRGGVQTKAMVDNKQKVFPFTQYYVQNIEAALTLNAGANEYTYISVTASIVGTKSATIPFVGSNGLFKLGADGQFTKRYIPAQDRMVFTISGEASLNSIAMSVSGVTVDSKNYVLPINNNVDIVITSGTTTIEKDAALLPGVTVLIAKDAELKVASAASLYVYDDAEWSKDYVLGNNPSGIHPVSYSPSGKGSRGIADAKVDVNGVLTVEGAVYTTATGANITSSEKTGKYAQVGAPGTSNKTYQFKQNSKEYIGVDITAAKLKNADNSYTKTANAIVGKPIPYCTCPTCGGGNGGKWLKDFAAIINSDGSHMDDYPTLQKAVDAYNNLDDSTAPKKYIQMLHSTTGDSTTGDVTTGNVPTNKDLYLDLNGCTVTGTFKMGSKTLYGMDSATDKYDGTSAGKLDGTVTGKVALVHETSAKKVAGYDSLRYVAIKSGNSYSFHRFNISVTGYRCELAAPQCALIFRGEFRGDEEAKKHLKSLGFTLKGENSTESKNEMFEALNKEFVNDEGDAYRFEFYLKRSFEKNSPDNTTAYTEKFSAIAHAKFDNGGTLDSKTKDWSFKEAWQNSGMKQEDKAILQNFLNEFGIKIQVE